MSTRARRYYPLDPRRMAATCRQLARDLRREHAMGWGPVPLGLDEDSHQAVGISRLDAADSLDEQADRWLEELKTGIPNAVDRSKLGMP